MVAIRLAALCLLSLLWPAGSAWALDLVVVVNPGCAVARLTRDDVINLYMGRLRKLPDGTAARPIDLLTSSGQEKQQFYQRLLSRDLSEVRAYWARLTFSGQASPPVQAETTEEVLSLVQRNPGGIGYVERSRSDARVRIVFELGDK
ncbi:hypothetical protein [Niveibacterium microcysteis]|uniref:Phosphate ABC transporter substrate-binding protein n=1 Tax=Niveibacterium microcysteis TaxID=2811415 RepID=A0ABX7M5X6_9RHOO|nr:hypothetical protein [Niveibacterium microcysteis]QSI76336.1 hypothetical protein JY500_17990 [Niveibacterium microcysteis]